MARRRTTTKDVARPRQLFNDKQLNLAPEFQRNSVWPRAAKAYLIDTILHDLPLWDCLPARRLSLEPGGPDTK